MLQLNVGDNTTAADPSDDFVPVGLLSGATVTVTNVAGSNLNIFANGIDGGVTATLTATQSQGFAGSVDQTMIYLQSAGVTTVTLAGGYF